jgi:glycosyltransferase involved in cell wall biosynthesis
MVSVIIPAYNEELLLGQTLRAVNDAGGALGEPFEVIVADDASTDHTASIAREHGARVVSAGHRQIAATRNAGAQAASGEMFLFVDADTTVNPSAVGAAIRAMRNGAVGGGCAFRFDGRLPLYARIMAAVVIPLYRVLRLASGSFLFCTRPAFEAVGGFDEGLYGAEEAVMSWRLRRQGRFVVLREVVVTSWRKLRAYSPGEILALLARLACAGPNAVRRRQGLELWYGERRPDPGYSAEPEATPHRDRQPGFPEEHASARSPGR